MKLINKLIPIKDWQKLSVAQQLTMLVNMCAVFAASITYSVKGNESDLYYYIALTLLASAVSEKMIRAFFEVEMREYMSRILNQKADLEYIGDQKKALIWFSENYHGITHVYNTAFNRSNINFAHMSDVDKRYQRAIVAAIKDRCTWNDITVADEVDNILSFRKSLTGAVERKRYNAFIIEVKFPMLECMVMLNADDDSKCHVMLGYGLSGHDTTRVYRSSNRETVDYFKLYLREMIKTATKIDFDEPALPNARAVNRSGEEAAPS